MAATDRVVAGDSGSWGKLFLQRKILALAVGLSVLISAGLFLQRNSGAWDSPRESIIRGSDDWCYYLWLPTVLGDRDVDFFNQFEAVPNWEPWVRENFLNAPPTETGRLPNKYPVGWAVASAPWYGAAIMLSPEKEGGRAIPSPWVEWWVLLGQWIYGVIGLVAAAVLLARFFGKSAAIWAVLAGWWCSPLLYYQTCALSMSHSLVFALVALIFVLTERLREDTAGWRDWIFLGLLAGLLLSVRPSALPYLLYPLLLLTPIIAREKLWGRGLLVVVAAVVAFFPQLLAWKTLYGHWLTYSYGGEGFVWAHPQLILSLFSPLHGWLYWHPAMVLGVGGLVLALAVGVGAERSRAGILLLILCLVTWLNSSWETWWYGVSFGGRAFEGSTLAVMAGFAWWGVRRSFPSGRMLAVLAVAFSLWNLNLVWLARHWRTTGIGLDAPVTYRQVIDASRRYYLSAGSEWPVEKKPGPPAQNAPAPRS